MNFTLSVICDAKCLDRDMNVSTTKNSSIKNFK